MNRLREAVQRSPVLVGVALALLVASVALVLVLVAQSNIRNTQRDLQSEKASRQALRDASFGLCRRLQVVRERGNRTEAVVYLTLESAAQREEALGRRSMNPATKALHARSARAAKLLAETAEYGGPTNCNEAVDRPLTYSPPKPVPFTQGRAAKEIPDAAKILLGGR